MRLLTLFTIIGIGLILTGNSWAQTSAEVVPASEVTTNGATEVNTGSSLGLFGDDTAEQDLEVDLAAESLPTTDRFSFWWENVRANIVRAFTFNAERKANLYQQHLHRLDRKAAACAEIGDEECLARVEASTSNIEERAERFISRRENLRDRLLERFSGWREDRAKFRQEQRERAQERNERRQKLLEQRNSRRPDALENRRERRDHLKELREEHRSQRQELLERQQQLGQDTIEQRQENQKQLLKLRSEHLHNKLENTQELRDRRQKRLQDEFQEPASAPEVGSTEATN